MTVLRGWERHPADLARFVVALGTATALALSAWLLDDSWTAVGTDLIRLFANIPNGATSALVGLVQLVVVFSVVVASAVLVIGRRWKLMVLLAISAALAAVAMTIIVDLLSEASPAELAGRRAAMSWLTGSAFPSATLLATTAAVVTATSSFMSRSWHRIAWVTVVGIALLRVLTATEAPVNLLLMLAVGSAMGSAALLITGAPQRRVQPEVIASALERVGLSVGDVTRIGEQRSAPSFRVEHRNQKWTYATLIDRDQRDYDLLLRVWRSLRIKGFNERRPLSSPRRSAEHEQLVLALAGAAEVSATRPVALATTEDGATVVVTTWVEGESLGKIGADRVNDETLTALWQEVAKLHSRRIAHRWLNLDSVMIGSEGPVLVGFRWSATNVDDAMLGADVAELLGSMAARFGVDRSVRAAVSGLGREKLEAALPRFQPLVISSATKDELKNSGISMGYLRDSVGAAIGAEKIELEPLGRVSLKGLVSLVGSLVLAGYVFSLASDWRSIADALVEMRWSVVPLLVLVVLLANAGGALSMMGSVSISLAFMRTNQIMFAQGFLNRFTPANAGGMALRARYLQREGVPLNLGAAAVGLTSAANGIVQAGFIAVFLIWGGATDELSRFSFPSVTKILTLVLAIAAIVGIIALSGWGRRKIIPKVRESFGPAVASFADLARQPTKLVQLFGGAALTKAVTIIAFAGCVAAFGVDLDFARMGALYMVANTVGAAVPTPGGVGGLEAALTAALISGGVEPATAGAVVLVFRLFTFWLPTIPGWICLQRAQRTGIV